MGRDFALKMPQIKEAARLYRIGLSRRQVAAHFGKSERAVTNALRIAGEPMRDHAYAAALALSKDPQKHYARIKGNVSRETRVSLGPSVIQ